MITNTSPVAGFTSPVIARLSPLAAQTLITGLNAANAARQSDVAATAGIYSGDAAKPFSGFCHVDQWALDNVGENFGSIPALAGETLQLGDVVVWPSINGDCDGSGELDPTDQWVIDQHGAPDWFRGDFNGDGQIDAADQAIFDAAVAAQ
jgi:hypothetical protein